MSYNDPIGDLFTRLRNAQSAGHDITRTRASKHGERVLDVLQDEGYIRGYKRVKADSGHDELEVELKYFEGRGAFHTLQRISTPGRRVYAGAQNLPRIHNGLGVAIISTPLGVLPDYKARTENVGGEVIGKVF